MIDIQHSAFNIKHNVNRTLAIVLLSVVMTALLCACASTPKTNEPSRSGFHLKKRICITQFQDRKHFDDTYLDHSFQELLLDALASKCKKPVFILPGQDDFPEEFVQLPVMKSGLMDNMVLMEVGRQNGFNAIVTGSVTDIRQSDENGWLQGEKSYMQVTITAEVFDTQTGARLMDKTYLREIEVDVDKVSEAAQEDEYFDIEAIEEAFGLIVADMQENICETISDLPWKGFIIGSKDDRVIISAGENAGLKNGKRLNIYRNDQIIVGAFGSRYRIPGPKIGELKLVSVAEHQSEAILTKGSGATPGNSVSLK